MTTVAVAYIDAYRGQFGVQPICRVLSEHGVPAAAGTYYAARARQPSAKLLALLEGFADSDQADAAAGGVEDDVGHPPAELLEHLEAHRLLALEPVRLLQRGHVKVPVPCDRVGDNQAGVTDEAVDEIHPGSGDHAFARVIAGAPTGITMSDSRFARAA